VKEELSVIERAFVALAILKEKEAKYQAMVSGDRDIPRELTVQRELPSLGRDYSFSASAKLKVEEFCKQQDRLFVEMLLQDLSGKVIPDSLADIKDALEIGRRRVARKVDAGEAIDAGLEFEREANKLYENKEELLKKRRPQKRKPSAREEDQQRPRKRPRTEEQKSRSHPQHRNRQKKPAPYKRH